jgi:hypothetical protein
MIKAERALLVMTGYLHPMQDEIDMGLIQIGNNNHGNFLAMLSAVDDILGTGLDIGTPPAEPIPDPNFPHQTEFEEGELLALVANKSSKEYHHPWDYPETPVEKCPTFAGPFPDQSMPKVLVDGVVPANEALYEKYAHAPTPRHTDTISITEVTATTNLGDPVNFSSYLIWQLARDSVKRFTDFNMDADRGYGYKCWDWNRRPDVESNTLPDKENHPYLRPCTDPPQAPSAMPYDPDVPLKIYYIDGEDPGCDVEVVCPDFGRQPKPRGPIGPRTSGEGYSKRPRTAGKGAPKKRGGGR